MADEGISAGQDTATSYPAASAGQGSHSAQEATHAQVIAAPHTTTTASAAQGNTVEHGDAPDPTAHLQIDPQVDNSDADSAFGSLLSAASASLSSSVKDYIFENGRRYNAYRPGEYWGPNDDQEQDRMDMQHHMFCLTLRGRLFRSPITTKPQHVLDLGTGTGIWAMQFADEYPSAQVTGTDLSPIQPSWVPPNCKFIVDDFEDQWLFSNKTPFDFIHGRILCGSVRDWNKLFKQAYENLKPGGWVEFQEYGMAYYSDDDPELTKVPNLKYWLSLMKEIGLEIGKPFQVDEMKTLMKDNGLVDVCEDHFKMPMGRWPADLALKEVGLFNQAIMLESLEPYTLALLTHVRHWTVEECMILNAKVKHDITHIGQNKSHNYCKFRITYGRRPLDP